MTPNQLKGLMNPKWRLIGLMVPSFMLLFQKFLKLKQAYHLTTRLQMAMLKMRMNAHPRRQYNLHQLEQSQESKDARKALGTIYEKVLVVDDVKSARSVVQLLTAKYRNFFHACDTEILQAKLSVREGLYQSKANKK
uniref:Uncharacterized protein n=1 Tax=Setaria viridis TaxID=4556 RepID=A0A4U6TVK9_SETVI|nr:hypothetical protein SEVIR_7G267733v2 [Setaria viridis]